MGSPADIPLAVTEALRDLAADAPLTATLRGLLGAARRHLGARRSLVLLAGQNGDFIAAAADGLTSRLSAAEEIRALRPAIETAMKTGRVFSAEEPAGEIRFVAAAPVLLEGRAAGALVVHHDAPPGSGAIAPLADLAHAAATAVALHSLRERRAEDELVGGPTARMFLDRLQAEVARAAEYGRLLALVACTIDRYVEHSSALLPEFRRELLSQAAARLRAPLARSALLARVPSDPGDPARFLVLLPEADRARSLRAAEEMRLSLTASPIPLPSGLVPVTASFGVAAFPDDAVDAETLLMTAETALRSAAATGDSVHDFRGRASARGTGAFSVAGAPTREGRVLGAMLRRIFASPLDLHRQLDLAAEWLVEAADASGALLAALDDDGGVIADGVSGLNESRMASARDLARRAAESGQTLAESGAIAVPLDRAVVVLDRGEDAPGPASVLHAMLGAVGAQVGEALQASVALEKHRRDLRARRDAVARTLEELRSKYDFSTIVGTSAKILEALQVVVRAAPTRAAVLVTGESGTGKELIARAIHANSLRRAGPFVVMNCAAVPPSLLESELFGHARGAFTGAVADRKGLFESADGGTLFLDEVAETGPEVQAKLLRALQFGDIQRVGTDEVRRVDVRVVAATNRALAEEVKTRRFREDLYYRINVFRVALPALRERPEDIPRLVEHFVARFSTELNRPPATVEAEAMAALVRYPWPGNVRELENIVLRSVAYATGGTITLRDLPEEVMGLPQGAPEGIVPRTFEELEQLKRAGQREVTDRLEKAFIDAALKAAGGNISEAARTTGINRTSLQKLVAKHGIEVDGYKKT